MHTRKTIRDAVVALLLNNTSAGANVYPNRETALWSNEELPAILVYTKDESAVARDASGRQTIRTLDLVIEIKISAETSVDDDLDALCSEVEDIMSANSDLTATAISSQYKNTQIELDASSEIEIGVAALTYEVKYIK